MEVTELREKYPNFRYKKYKIEEKEKEIIIEYEFEIENLDKFFPKIVIAKKDFIWRKINTKKIETLVFLLGMVEAISYFKLTCSKNFIIESGVLDSYTEKWFSDLYYFGLGEFRFRNNIDIKQNDFVNFISKGSTIEKIEEEKYSNHGLLIPVGGGKDSNVTMSLLEEYKEDTYCFSIGGKDVVIECCKEAGFGREKIVEINRILDKNMIKLNNEGFLNGHTPFSAIVAFISYLVAELLGKKYIPLSNEDSANESNVFGEKINHQYSKTYEFENNFRELMNKYIDFDVEYFSFLRPITELQIGMLFARFKKYHKVFKSCNVGSKEKPWVWCANCPKCLFVYIILSPFLKEEELKGIFGENIYDKKDLLEIFLELCGFRENKPFECVGTFEEVRFAVSMAIKNYEKEGKSLPQLLEYYKNNYKLEEDFNYLEYYNEENFLPEEFEKILKENLKKEI